jgi:ketosteroid isomerase-like protein
MHIIEAVSDGAGKVERRSFQPCIIAAVNVSTTHEQILAARDAINRAIAARDVDGIAAYLLPTYHVVTARSMHRDGRDASAKSWGDLFAHDSKAVHSRTPEQIHVNDAWGMAQEHGRWTATVSAKDGPLQLGGVYAAKWHLAEGAWRLEVEIFTPLSVD